MAIEIIMKKISFSWIFLTVLSGATAFAEESSDRFEFPPFETIDVGTFPEGLGDFPSDDVISATSTEDLRALMTSGSLSKQYWATQRLIERNDLPSILRLVYSLKQGNAIAEEILRRQRSLAVVPYLLEDVAHGSLDYYGAKLINPGHGAVRVAATAYVATTLASAAEISGPTKEFLRAVNSGQEEVTFSDQSRYLIRWWLLNEDAINAGLWDQTQPLPDEIKYIFPDYTGLRPPTEPEPPDPVLSTPKFGPSWELPESFEDWSKRIVDPKRRNLDFIEFTWNNGKWIEHAAKSLDTRQPAPIRPDRTPRRSPHSRNPSDSESGDGMIAWIKGVRWQIAGIAFVIAAGWIGWRMNRRIQ